MFKVPGTQYYSSHCHNSTLSGSSYVSVRASAFQIPELNFSVRNDPEENKKKNHDLSHSIMLINI
jgi:hypothetical protein